MSMIASSFDSRKPMRLALFGAVLLLVAGVALAWMNEAIYRVRAVNNLAIQANILTAGVGAALAFDDRSTMDEYLRVLSVNPDLASAAVYDDSGVRLAAFARPGAAASPSTVSAPERRYAVSGMVVTAPVTERGTRLGWVRLQSGPEPLERFLRRHGAFALLLLMGVLVAGAMGRAAVELRRRADALAQANENILLEADQRRKAEDALHQSQKMESLGQLTGGVAHDFNNLLTVVIGGLETIGRQLSLMPATAQSERLERARDMAMQGAQKAATLTKRLLDFSRRQPLAPTSLDINRMVQGVAELIQRTLGETISLECVIGAGAGSAMADASQLENALLNLAVNARDAMPHGGRLTLETAHVRLEAAPAGPHEEATVDGDYVMIAVSDTGAGMDAQTRARVFEPFFTTKEVGKGTGLGLSQVYGFVRQSGGQVRVYSEPGEGTCVKIYLPRLAQAAPAADAAPPAASRADTRGSEAVLLVEDHPNLRVYSAGILRELGYQVHEAGDAAEALAILDQRSDIELLFTDVVLPGGRNGRQLADEALRRRPALKVLFTTGYTRNAIVHNGMLDPGVRLISKPFTFDQLAQRLREVLDEPA